MPYTPPSRRPLGASASTASTTVTDLEPHTTGGHDSTPGDKRRWRHPQARSNTWPPLSVQLPLGISCSEPPTSISTNAYGQVIHSVLRTPSSQRRSSDAQFIRSKSVHFDSQVDVRHFFRGEEPRAVSTRSSSPTGSSHEDSDNEDCSFELVTSKSHCRDSLLELVTSIPAATAARRGQPAWLERVWLVPSNGNTHSASLRGSVAVANFAYNKCVTCRFTFDSWTTQSDIAAVYESAIPSPVCEQPYDRFIFTIPINDIVDLERKTFKMCLRYQVSDFDFWENNNGTNFEVKFRHHPRRENDVQDRGGRQKSWTASHHSLFATAATCGEHRAKLKPADGNDKNNTLQDSVSTAGSTKLTAPTLANLSSRYELGASLAAAIKVAKTALRDRQRATDRIPLIRPSSIVQAADCPHYWQWCRHESRSTPVLT